MRSLLVANRGEIARRIIQTAHAMGLRTVAVFTEADRFAPHVDEADLAARISDYLDVQAVVEAAVYAGADAVHPGYGFLSERAAFAQACLDAGLTWVGPRPETIAAMGDKIEAKRRMAAAGVPVVPEGRGAGFPLVVKAAAGGGGRGMRVVVDPDELDAAMDSASREAASAFGDGTVFLERWLTSARHVEVQVMGDAFGRVVHLGERECSIQRRHQKVIEESPSPTVSASLRQRMLDAAVAGATSIGYVGAGTFEFIAEGDDFYFLEMNTRLQVEHPVTELVTGLDLVRLQLEVAAGGALAVDEVLARGHAIEARLYAEDPANGYLPSPGVVLRWRPGATPGVRYDSGVRDGTPVPAEYDPMLAKLIVHAPSRAEATARLVRALRELQLHGVNTNRDQLVAALEDPRWAQGTTTTDFLDSLTPMPLLSAEEARIHVLAASLADAATRRNATAVLGFAPPAWRNMGSRSQQAEYEGADVRYRFDNAALDRGGYPGADATVDATVNGVAVAGRLHHLDPERVDIEVGGVLYRCGVHIAGPRVWVNSASGQSQWREVPRFVEPSDVAVGRGPTTPLPGTIVAVEVQAGETVKVGQVLVVLEAMKMEHRILAPSDAVVSEVVVSAGQRVDAGQVVVVLS